MNEPNQTLLMMKYSINFEKSILNLNSYSLLKEMKPHKSVTVTSQGNILP